MLHNDLNFSRMIVVVISITFLMWNPLIYKIKKKIMFIHLVFEFIQWY